MAYTRTKPVSFEQIFINIQLENLNTKQRKVTVLFNALKLNVSGDKKELLQRLEPLARCKKLFSKKVPGITEDYKFSTALDSNLISPPSAI